MVRRERGAPPRGPRRGPPGCLRAPSKARHGAGSVRARGSSRRSSRALSSRRRGWRTRRDDRQGDVGLQRAASWRDRKIRSARSRSPVRYQERPSKWPAPARPGRGTPPGRTARWRPRGRRPRASPRRPRTGTPDAPRRTARRLPANPRSGRRRVPGIGGPAAGPSRGPREPPRAAPGDRGSSSGVAALGLRGRTVSAFPKPRLGGLQAAPVLAAERFEKAQPRGAPTVAPDGGFLHVPEDGPTQLEVEHRRQDRLFVGSRPESISLDGTEVELAADERRRESAEREDQAAGRERLPPDPSRGPPAPTAACGRASIGSPRTNRRRSCPRASAVP